MTLGLARRAGMVNLAWWRDCAEKSVESDMAAMRELKPDVVVGDMRLSLSTSAAAMKIPCVGLTNGAWTSRFAERIHVPEGHHRARPGQHPGRCPVPAPKEADRSPLGARL